MSKHIERHLTDGFNDYEITPEGLIIHWVSARYTLPEDPYNPDEIIRILEEHGLAYHDLICRDGTIIELVPAPLRAWHAGESAWNGRDDCNSWTLGEALAGMEDEPYTDAQYDALAHLTAERVQRFPIREGYIRGHDEVAPDRKIDPGPMFKWSRYRNAIAGLWRPQ